ncbi:tetratricopeptide repeat protein [Paenibacillus sp. IB182496]|uniref:Tetratricopeptide repeat protein n=1 Tax=Paenibacillus sabuli TaxID=2772509 RepID=A0A927BWQ1_9BACL|nr:tetratricopeptide repeat protein [Paenibacillus sabuli]MBD2847030.1 tetratricopeptide repeat protein [Paenibacillus sabuli]
METMQEYVDLLLAGGQFEDAIGHLEEMLELNPNDNQGMRYTLLNVYMATDRLAETEQLIADYNDDITAAFAYSGAWLEYLKNGPTSTFKMKFRAAKNTNAHVPDYLVSRKPLPQDLPEVIGFGDENEAIAYVASTGPLWVKIAPALEWLTSNEEV